MLSPTNLPASKPANACYVFLDLETGGFDPQTHAILSIGIVYLDEHYQVVGHGYTYVNELEQRQVTQSALEKNRIDLGEIERSGMSHDELNTRLPGLLQGLTIIGHNVQFDVDFLNQRFGLGLKVGQDTLNLARKMLRGTVQETAAGHFTLENLTRHFNIDTGTSHNALADAEASAMLMSRLGQINELAVNPQADLSKVAGSLFGRYGTDMAGMVQELDAIGVPPGQKQQILNQIVRENQTDFMAATPSRVASLGSHQAFSNVRGGFNQYNIENKPEAFRKGEDFLYTRERGATHGASIEDVYRAGYGTITRGTGSTFEVMSPKEPKSVLTGKMSREEIQKVIKVQHGPSGMQPEVGLLAYADTGETLPVGQDLFVQYDKSGQALPRYSGQYVRAAFPAVRAWHEGAMVSVGREKVLQDRQLRVLQGVRPEDVIQGTIQGEQVPYYMHKGESQYHMTKDWASTSVRVRSSGQNALGNYTMAEVTRQVPLQGHGRFDLIEKSFTAFHTDKDLYGLGKNSGVDVALSVNEIKNKGVGFWRQVISGAYHQQGKAFFEEAGFGHLLKSDGTVDWNNPDLWREDTARGGLSPYQELAMSALNNKEMSWRNGTFAPLLFTQTTRTGGYSWSVPHIGLERAAQIRTESPALFDRIRAASAHRQQTYGSVFQSAFGMTETPGSGFTTPIVSANDLLIGTGNILDPQTNRAVQLQTIEQAFQAMNSGQGINKNTQVAVDFLDEKGKQHKAYLTLRQLQYFGGQKVREDVRGLSEFDPSEHQKSIDERPFSRFANAGMEMLLAGQAGKAVPWEIAKRYVGAMEELATSHDIARLATGFTSQRTYGGPVSADTGVEMHEAMIPNSALMAMFPETRKNPALMTSLKAKISGMDIGVLANREPTISSFQLLKGLKVITQDELLRRPKTEGKDWGGRMVVNDAMMANIQWGDFDPDAMRAIFNAAFKLNKEGSDWDVSQVAKTLTADDLKIRAAQIQEFAKSPDYQAKNNEDLAVYADDPQAWLAKTVRGMFNRERVSVQMLQQGYGEAKQGVGQVYNLARGLTMLEGGEDKIKLLAMTKMYKTFLDSMGGREDLESFLGIIQGHNPLKGNKHGGGDEYQSSWNMVFNLLRFKDLPKQDVVLDMLFGGQTEARDKIQTAMAGDDQALMATISQTLGGKFWDQAEQYGVLAKYFKASSLGKMIEPGGESVLKGKDYLWGYLGRGMQYGVDALSGKLLGKDFKRQKGTTWERFSHEMLEIRARFAYGAQSAPIGELLKGDEKHAGVLDYMGLGGLGDLDPANEQLEKLSNLPSMADGQHKLAKDAYGESVFHLIPIEEKLLEFRRRNLAPTSGLTRPVKARVDEIEDMFEMAQRPELLEQATKTTPRFVPEGGTPVEELMGMPSYTDKRSRMKASAAGLGYTLDDINYILNMPGSSEKKLQAMVAKLTAAGGPLRASSLGYPEGYSGPAGFGKTGTQAHSYLSDYLRSGAVSGVSNIEEQVEGFGGALQGHTDFVGDMFGKRTVFDLKTSTRAPETFSGQLAAYQYMTNAEQSAVLPVSRDEYQTIRREELLEAREEHSPLSAARVKIGERLFQTGMSRAKVLSPHDTSPAALLGSMAQYGVGQLKTHGGLGGSGNRTTGSGSGGGGGGNDSGTPTDLPEMPSGEGGGGGWDPISRLLKRVVYQQQQLMKEANVKLDPRQADILGQSLSQLSEGTLDVNTLSRSGALPKAMVSRLRDLQSVALDPANSRMSAAGIGHRVDDLVYAAQFNAPKMGQEVQAGLGKSFDFMAGLEQSRSKVPGQSLADFVGGLDKGTESFKKLNPLLEASHKAYSQMNESFEKAAEGKSSGENLAKGRKFGAVAQSMEGLLSQAQASGDEAKWLAQPENKAQILEAQAQGKAVEQEHPKGLLGRFMGGKQLMTGMEMFYLNRMDRMFVEPALKGAIGGAQDEMALNSVMARTGMYNPREGGTALQAMASMTMGQNAYQRQAAATWTPVVKGAADLMAGGAGGPASILMPALGAAAMGAYVGNIIPGIGPGMGALVAGGTSLATSVFSRAQYMKENPAFSQREAYESAQDYSGGAIIAGPGALKKLGGYYSGQLNYATSLLGGKSLQEISDERQDKGGLVRNLNSLIAGGGDVGAVSKLSPDEKQDVLWHIGQALVTEYKVSGEVAQAVMGQGSFYFGNAKANASQLIQMQASGVNIDQLAPMYSSIMGGGIQAGAQPWMQFANNPGLQQDAAVGMGMAGTRALALGGLGGAQLIQAAAGAGQMDLSGQMAFNAGGSLVEQARQQYLTTGIRSTPQQEAVIAQAQKVLAGKTFTEMSSRDDTERTPKVTAGHWATTYTQNLGGAQVEQQTWVPGSTDYGTGGRTTRGTSFLAPTEKQQVAASFAQQQADFPRQVGVGVESQVFGITGDLAQAAGIGQQVAAMGADAAGAGRIISAGMSGNANVLSMVGTMNGNQSLVTRQTQLDANGIDNRGMPLFTTNMGWGNQSPQQVMKANFAGAQPWVSNILLNQGPRGLAAAGQLNYNPVSQEAYGGTLGLQQASSKLSYQQAMASAGAQLAQLKLGHAFTTGIGLGDYGNTLGNTQFGTPSTALSQYASTSLAQPGGMWGLQDQSRALANQQFAWQMSNQTASRELQGAQFQQGWNLNRQQAVQQYGWQQEDFSRQQRVNQLQRGFQMEDFSFGKAERDRHFGWQMEDTNESMRFLTGRERKLAERQKGRVVEEHGIGEERASTLESRQKIMWKEEDDRLGVQKVRANELFKLALQRFDIDKKNFEDRQKLEANAQDMQIKFYGENQRLQLTQQDLERTQYELAKKESERAIGASAGFATKQNEINDTLADIAAKQHSVNNSLQWQMDTEIAFFNNLGSYLVLLTQFMATGGKGQLPTMPGVGGTGQAGVDYTVGPNGEEGISPIIPPGGASGASRLITSPTLFQMGETGSEVASFSGGWLDVKPYAANGVPGFSASGSGRSGPDTIHVNLVLDGKVLASQVIRITTNELYAGRRR